MVKKCGGSEDMVWTCPKTRLQVEHMPPMTVVMGDISTLGWVIVKCACIENEDLPGLMIDMGKLQTQVYKGWQVIQSSNQKLLQFSQLHKHNDLYTSPASRRMRFADYRGFDDMKGLYPSLKKLMDRNEDVCSEFMSNNTPFESNFEFRGHNILGNLQGVKEQVMHTDYSYYIDQM